jgi:hypothetical protein
MAAAQNPILWDTLLDAEMNTRYWAKLTGVFTRNCRWLKFFVALTSSGTAIAAWSIWQTHPILWKGVASVSCVLSIYQSFIVPDDRVKKCATLAATWKELATRYNLLWIRDRDMTSAESNEEFSTMKIRESSLDETDFTKNEKLLNEAYREVLKARG